ncbi:MAG: competence/damage-inducible protein A [Gemmatimonadaceae bacterium]
MAPTPLTRIEVVTIGDELLLGHTLDSNAAHLSRALSNAGIEVIRRTTVGDAPTDIADVVREGLDRVGAVITTGGLGPTSDDVTKAAVAHLFDRAMHVDEALLQAMRDRWTARGWRGELPAANRQQAMIPERATILVNRHGSAPGIWLEDDRGRWVAMLPGVPREMRGMLADELLPRIVASRRHSGERVVRSRTVRTTGVSESALADLIGDPARFGALALAYLPSWEGTDLRLTARNMTPAGADRALADAAKTLRDLVGEAVYGEDGDDLSAMILAACRERSLRLAVAESCTGGLLGARLTAIPGASDVFVGGVIAYDDAVKSVPLGVSAELIARYGAVSEPVARAMAAGVCQALGAAGGISVTGVAGPGGGTAQKPVGTVWVAVTINGRVEAAHAVLTGDRGEIQHRATQMALDVLRRRLGGATG